MSGLSIVGTALVTALSLALGAAVAAVLLPRWRPVLVGPLVALSGAAGVVAGGAAVTGQRWSVDLPDLLPLAGVSLRADALAGWFLALVGAVTAVVGIYATSYPRWDGQAIGSRTSMAVLPLFTGSMLLVPVAASVPTFLLTWELMAVTSLLLVMTEHRHHEQVRPAAAWYAGMTQAGFVTILVGLVWLAAAHGGDFDAIRAGAAALPAGTRAGIFLLCLVGFAAKAGAVPLHPWLPRAHAEAPSHVSALMSAAMVKLGIYGLLRVGFDLLGGGPSWWWLIVAVLGGVSALYGIVQAVVATDLKRLLAFSTSENIGLILLGVGFTGLFAAAGRPAAAALALAATLLHTINHAGFKTLLFLGAGSVLRATGTRDLDRLGGLSRRMRATTALVAGGAVAAAALPPGNGFVSEWLLLQSLLHQTVEGATGSPGTMLSVAAPIAVAVIALTAGVGCATYVKAVGTGFLARPRTDAAAQATESPAMMIIAMVLAGLACLALAVVPTLTVPAITRVSAGLRLPPSGLAADPVQVRLAGMAATFWPLWIAVALVVVVAGTALAARALGRKRRRAIAWDCGDGALTARMEYTATSFTEPLQRVFDNTLAPERAVNVTPVPGSRYFIDSIQFAQRIPDRVEARLYTPVRRGFERLGELGRRLAPGVMHRYLIYMLSALIVVLVAGVLA